MRRRAAPIPVLALAALLGSCTAPHHDTVMQGNATGVVINYYGDVAATMPLAQQFCARYERTPVLHETKEENAYYFCVKAAEAPRLTS